MPVSEPLIKMAELREKLKNLMQPKVLSALADFLEATGGDNSFVDRYKWFCENAENGPDCRYAAMSKSIFLSDYAQKTAETIIWLYDHWAKHYRK